MSRKRPRSVSPPSTSTIDARRSQTDHQIFRSNAIKDRSSTFIALFSPSAPAPTLQANPDFATATHRVAAWRKPSAQRTLFTAKRPLLDTGYDDDGEQYAGKRLEKVLSETSVEGAVVVARWYGGILLGPVRFTHIENCAREAIEKWKASGTATKPEPDHPAAQKRKIEEDAKRKSTLVSVLEERDHSISALRGLLREKTEEACAIESEEKVPTRKDGNVTPDKAVDYSAMPLQALVRLEKARDASISWILKEIEKVEERLEEQQQQQQQQKKKQKRTRDCG
ncbi:hypothetical protein EPUS_08195 [Endocarpon pusillum Z07020]|uniref:Impact N-terminal domain-containing protein n=1 Tax=Endocarpon pusillum (strain Z07020 / HMAS-L-300199) TaxID=1263415 RepID=U1GB90_ENDPU|nr:uncharacterized protein EPUS_08195 [Endocarpon pusillum Z07020]ERF68961.1 hypothetical protein EPUS_08195 [Endocarpon pusillum Z07020]